MLGIFRILIFWIFTIGAIIFILYQITNFLFTTNGVRSRLRRDLKFLDRQLSPFLEGLIPFEVDELKLLSANPISKISRKRVSIINKGYLSTIYQEPLFAFAIKNYPGSEQALLKVKSQAHDFTFHFDETMTRVSYDGNDYGYISLDHILVDMEGKNEMAKIDYNISQQYAAIIADNEDIAHLNLEDIDGKPVSERAFSKFHGFKGEDAEKLIIVILYHLILKPFVKL